MFPELIETERLRLERFDAVVEPLLLYRHAGEQESPTIAEETKYVTWGPHDTPKESEEVIETFADAWAERESATYAIVPKAGEDGAGEFAGNAGISFEWDRKRGTLGIWLRKPFWGRRYSGERAAALASLAFDRLGLEVVAAEVVPDNENSVRAIERYIDRLGGQREGLIRNRVTDQDGTIRDGYRFSVTREEFDAHGPDPSVTFHDTLEHSALDAVTE